MSQEVWETPHGVKMRFPTDAKPYYRLDYVLGGRRRQPSVGRDKDIAWAEALRADVLVAVDDGDLGELSARDMLEAWYAEGCEHWSETYKKANRNILDKFLLPAMQHVAVTDLRRGHIAEAIKSGSTPRMCEVIRSACSSALRWAEAQNWLTSAAATLMPPKGRVASSRSSDQSIDPDEIPDVADVLALAEWMEQPRQPKKKKGRVVEQDEYRAYTVLIAAFCGLRLGEMLALRGRHVNGDVLTVEAQVQYISGKGNLILTPKSGKSRKVVVPENAGKWKLSAWLVKRAAEVGPEGFLFPAPQGGLWSATNYRRHVLDPARAAVWPGRKWSYHSLRHTFCTSLLTQGVSINDVAAMAGHSSPMVTANIYIGKQASAIDRVRKLLNEG